MCASRSSSKKCCLPARQKKRMMTYKPLLSILKGLDPEEAGHLIGYLNDDAVHFLCESLYNLLHNYSHVPEKHKLWVSNLPEEEKKKLRYLARKKHSLVRKRNLLQKGGNPFILLSSIVLPLVEKLLFPSS